MFLDKKTVGDLTRAAQKCGTDDIIHFDDELTGFGLRLRRGGGGQMHGTFVAQYRASGRTRRMKVGAIEKLSAEEARKAAKRILAKVELGGDPQAEKEDKRAKSQHTMRAVVAEYLEEKQRTLRPASYKVTRLYLEGQAYFGPLHNMAITDIALPDVAARISTITRKNGAVTAGRARAALSAMFRWAMGQGLMGTHPTNPVAATNRPPAAAERDRVLKDSELAAVLNACRDDEHGRIVRLLALTGCRRDEIGGLRWSEIDMQERTLTLPSERVKNGHAHRLPLSDAMIDIIKGTPHRLYCPTLFGGHRSNASGRGFTDWSQGKRNLDGRIGKEVAPWRLHDLRRSVATGMADIGVQPHIIEEILNHRSGHKRGVAGVYNRSTYEPEVRAALAKWAKHVAEIVDRPRLRIATGKSRG
jgi:integrase